MAFWRFASWQIFGLFFFLLSPLWSCNRMLDWDALPPAECGNGIWKRGNLRTVLMSSLTCQSLGYESGETQCRKLPAGKKLPYLRRWTRRSIEACTYRFAGKTCGSLGYYGGEHGMHRALYAQFFDCSRYESAATAILQSRAGEMCDEWEFGTQTCASFISGAEAMFCGEFCLYFRHRQPRSRTSGISMGRAPRVRCR